MTKDTKDIPDSEKAIATFIAYLKDKEGIEICAESGFGGNVRGLYMAGCVMPCILVWVDKRDNNIIWRNVSDVDYFFDSNKYAKVKHD